jgi:hypothetical protein
MVTLPFVKVIGPQLAIGFMTGEHVKRTDDEGMGHRDDGPLLPPTSGQTLVQGGQMCPLRSGGGMGDLGQARA